MNSSKGGFAVLCCFRFVALVIFVAYVAPLARAAERPNVLFIAVDDLNDWVGCLGGHPDAHTPNIDRLARRGTLFTNAHCQGPICGPSRASLLSGLYLHTHGVYAQPKGLDKDSEQFHGHLLPQHFAKHGYATFGGGKITHGYDMKRAFQHVGPRGSSGPKPAKGKRFNYHLPDVPWTGTQTDWGAFPERDEQMPDHQTADWAIDTLKKEHTKPFFLAVGFVRPHVPFYVPQKWFERFPLDKIALPAIRDDDLEDVPEIGRLVHELPKYPNLKFLRKDNNKQLRLCTQAYLACTTFVDHQVGRVLAALEKSPYAKNTIVVLFSDHGYHLGEKDRVSKHSLWEESTRVPLVIALPGEYASQRCDLPVGLIDLYPTLTVLCGLPAKKSNQGDSLKPLLDDVDDGAAGWRFATITTYARKNHTLRSTRYRYIRYEDGSEELYDHKADPHGWTNLAKHKKHAALIAEFRKHLPKTDAPYHKACRSAPINAWFKDHYRRHGLTDK